MKSLDEYFGDIIASATAGRKVNGQVHALIHPDSSAAETVPAAPPAVPNLVAVTPSGPAAPVDTAWPWVSQVTTTCFGNSDDEKTGEWAQTAYGWYQCAPGSGMVDAFAALPFKCARGDAVNVRRADGHVVRVPVGDQGPWNDATRPDRYLPDGKRPEAETGTDLRGRKTNGAGLDLTPAAWSLVNDKPARTNWGGEPSGKFDVQWCPANGGPALVAPASAPVVHPEVGPAIRRAALALVGKPFPYAPGTEDGELGCADVASTALIHAGVLGEGELQLAVAGLDQVLQTKHGWKVTQAPYLDGDVIIWGPYPDPGQTHGHVGIIIIDVSGKVEAMNNSSSQKQPVLTDLATYDRPLVHVLRAPGGAA